MARPSVTVLSEDQIQFPVPTSGSSQPPVTQAPGDLIPPLVSLGSGSHAAFTHTDIRTYT